MSNLRMADVHWLRQMELSSAQRVKKKKSQPLFELPYYLIRKKNFLKSIGLTNDRVWFKNVKIMIHTSL